MTSFSDNFDRADSSDLGAGWVEVSGDWSIVSSQLSPGAAGGTIILRTATSMSTNDNFAQITIAATTAASQGVWCRGTTNLSDGYLFRNDGTTWDLFSVVGGSFTSLGTYAAPAAPGDVAKVQAVGTTIRAFVNGVEQISLTNSHVTSGTNVGIRSESAGAIRYDNFSAADVTTSQTGTGSASFDGLTATASGTRKTFGTAAAAPSTLTASANGTRKVTGAASFTGGALNGSVTGVRTVVASASASGGALTATASSPSQVTGVASAEFSGLSATARGGTPATPSQGSWYSLGSIIKEATQLAQNERERLPQACFDCGEPLRSGPHGTLYCPYDGSFWAAGNRRVYP
jgi:hypothetical protein